MSKAPLLCCSALLLTLAACAGSQTAPKDARAEFVVQEGLVVEGRAPVVVGDWELPPPVVPLDSASGAFGRGWEAALQVLAADGPRTPPAEGRSDYKAWAQTAFRDWIGTRSRAIRTAQAHLNRVASGPASEAVAASALSALMFDHTVRQFVSTPPPPNLRKDEELARNYRLGLDVVSSPWLKAAYQAYNFCAVRAGRERAAGFGRWLELCHARMGAIEESQKQAAQLAVRIEGERLAALLKAAGPPPAGPEVCWKPKAGTLPAVAPDGSEDSLDLSLDLLLRLPLLATERAELEQVVRRRVSALMAEHGLQARWLTEAERQAGAAAAQQGRLRVDGPRCNQAVNAPRVLLQGYPGLHRLRPRVGCADDDRGCHLVLGFEPPLGAAADLVFTAPLADPVSDKDHWLKAAESLVARRAQLGRWDEKPGREQTDAGPLVHELARYGQWADADPAAVLAQAAPALNSCGKADGLDDGDFLWLLDVNADGKVAVVEGAQLPGARRKLADCLQRHLSSLRFTAGDSQRRLSLLLSFGPRPGARDRHYGPLDRRTSVRVSASVKDAAHTDTRPMSDVHTLARLSACVERHSDPKKPGTTAVHVNLDIDPLGTVEQVELIPEPSEQSVTPSKALDRCLQQELKKTRFSCSQNGNPTHASALYCLRKE